MRTADHAIFAEAPFKESVTLSTGPAPVPYHVYDGHGLVILGYCPADVLSAFFADQDVFPVLTADGRGILVLFICDFAEASHGAHHEFHVTALSAPKRGQVVANDPAAALAALANQPDWGVLSLFLWNDTQQVVAYNSEYLGLQAQLSKGQVRVNERRLAFAFSDESGTALASGDVRVNARSDAGLMMRVMRHLGGRALWNAVRNRPARAHVINRKSDVILKNGFASTVTAPDKMVVTAFDPAADHVDFANGPLARLGFEPQIFEQITPFRFVYRHPDDV